jgi:signal-transduction protein with cAMP-binding, CBS, and nucleotidyltransferase domain
MGTMKLSVQRITEFLQHTKVFRLVEEEALRTLAAQLSVEHYEDNQQIIEQGGKGFAAFIVVHGKVGIYSDDILMAHFDKGQIFGEFSMLDCTSYSATAIAKGSVDLIRVDSDIVYKQIFNNESMARGVIGSLTKRLKRHLVV